MNKTQTDQIRVLLVDDHAVIRVGLRMLLESHPKLAVVGEASGRDEALALAAGTRPDIILLDLDLGGISSIDFLPELLAAAGQARVLLLTGSTDTDQHRKAVLRGAMGVVVKAQAAEVLLKAIEKVHAGEVWIDRTVMASVLSQMSRGGAAEKVDPEAAKIAGLSDREREVITLICQGLQNKHIGERMAISEATVRHHLTSIFNKLEITNRLELVIYAYRHDLVKPSQ